MSSPADNLGLTTLGGIPFAIVSGPHISHSREGTTAREVYRIRQSDLAAFAAESVPPPVVFAGFVQVLPKRRMPGAPWFITKTVQFDPWNSDTMPADPFGVYGLDTDAMNPYYRVTINYETGLQSVTEDDDPQDPMTFLEHSVNAGFESIGIAPRSVTFVDVDVTGDAEATDGDAARDVTVGVQKIVPTAEHTLHWPYALNPDWETILATLGKVNNAKLELFLSAPKETVMFVGCSGRQMYVWNGASAKVQPWSLDFHFSVRSINEDGKDYGWNHVYRPDTRRFESVIREMPDGSKRPLYESADLLDLFKAA